MKKRRLPQLPPRLLPPRTEQEAVQAAELERLQDAVATAGNVFYFEYDSSNLTADALSALNLHIALLHRNDNPVRLEGHTDERGTREYNLALGERRANSVRDYMVANGISSCRIESVSYGEERPAAIRYGRVKLGSEPPR